MTDISQLLNDTTAQLAAITPAEERMDLRRSALMPSVEVVTELMQLLRAVIFPGFFDRHPVREVVRAHSIGVDVERIMHLLTQQIAAGLVFCGRTPAAERCDNAQEVARQFIAQLPELRRVLLTDVEAVALNDPAVDNFSEVVFSYPVVQVMLHHRVAHALHVLGVPVLPRIISEQAHSATGIDIHPAAQIGEYFSIDHGTGVVIGATAIIGHHVMLYQGVTLGAKNFQRDAAGQPLDVPRHPIIEDRVVVYSNASILGRIRIGHDSVIGGNIWVTHDVPPHSRILQGKPIEQLGFTDGAGI